MSPTAPLHPTDGPISTWFGLSYCNYQVLHRTLMQSMPLDWQARMTACLEELTEAFGHIDQPEGYDVIPGTVHIVSEMSTEQLNAAGITEDWFAGETVPEGLSDEDQAEWEAEHEVDVPDYYDRGGDSLDPGQRVVVPCADPVPHYNRGRTYIEPPAKYLASQAPIITTEESL